MGRGEGVGMQRENEIPGDPRYEGGSMGYPAGGGTSDSSVQGLKSKGGSEAQRQDCSLTI